MGGKHDCAVAEPQVTGPGLQRVKIVRVFEFIPLTSAPGRIRTCAHGSGGRSCSRLLAGKTRAGATVGERMGGARWGTGSARKFLVFPGDCQHGSVGRQAGGSILMV